MILLVGFKKELDVQSLPDRPFRGRWLPIP